MHSLEGRAEGTFAGWHSWNIAAFDMNSEGRSAKMNGCGRSTRRLQSKETYREIDTLPPSGRWVWSIGGTDNTRTARAPQLRKKRMERPDGWSAPATPTTAGAFPRLEPVCPRVLDPAAFPARSPDPDGRQGLGDLTAPRGLSV